MWTITSEDVARAKERIMERRAEAEAKYAEALKSLDSELAEIDAMERFAGDFAGKFSRDEAAPAAESEERGAAGSGEGGHGSRWRLHLGGARGERESEGSLSR